MAQLLHATAVADGRLTLPLPGSAASWVIQNGVVVDDGWASIYPPLHTLALAAGVAAGALQMVGPLLTGLATGCFTWSADRHLGPVPGRLAGLLLLVSPFWILLGASGSSHVAGAAGLCLLLFSATRARAGGTAWLLGAGASVGVAVAARPWVGIVASAALLAALWWRHRSAGDLVRRFVWTALGGLPFAAFFFWWNQRLFASPLRLGYSAAFGPAHGLGLRVDPWGNRYGVVEALAFTSADLTQLGVRLFESPLPSLALVGAALVLRPLGHGATIFGLWALSGVASASAYWHHGIHFGPRMLYETVPAWTALFALASTALLDLDGSRKRAGPRPPEVSPTAASSHVRLPTSRSFARWTIVIAVVGGIASAPSRLRSVAEGSALAPLPTPAGTRALVFVHGGWASRISGRLVATGMRRDSVETALRRNDICLVDRYARWRADPGRQGDPPPLDFRSLSGAPSGLGTTLLSDGNAVRVDPELSFGPACAREARADRLGIQDLEPLAWRFPPLPDAAVHAARDMGPAGNIAVLEAVDRPAFVLIHLDDGGPLLLDYPEGMELLWGGAAGEAGRPPAPADLSGPVDPAGASAPRPERRRRRILPGAPRAGETRVGRASSLPRDRDRPRSEPPRPRR